MKPQVKRVLVLLLGWAFILVGIAGLFLPVIQGILCLLIGLMILSTEYVWAHHLLQKLKTKFPKIATVSEQAAEKAQQWLLRLTRKRDRNPSEPAPDRSDRSAGKKAEG
jgi:uncharacterized membrane protein YbaN (DUF454 family)